MCPRFSVRPDSRESQVLGDRGKITALNGECRHAKGWDSPVNEATFPLEDILSDRVFLAYGVNSVTLPQKHGFPLRLVAEGYPGSDWVKYVSQVWLDKS